MVKSIAVLIATLLMGLNCFAEITPISESDAFMKDFEACIFSISHQSTDTSEGTYIPTITDLSKQAKKAQLIAAKYGSGLTQYFSFDTDEDIKKLQKEIGEGKGKHISWFAISNKNIQKLNSKHMTVEFVPMNPNLGGEELGF